jgi:DMSO/TMAO reductase YedYZ molybdopterin-dependent catalytic subunit
MSIITRRGLIGFGGAAAGGLLLSGCDAAVSNDKLKAIVQSTEGATQRWQRLIGRNGLAQEFSAADLSPNFKVNGTHEPVEAEYQAHKAENFANWKLAIGGLVNNPMNLNLAQLRSLPARTQITRHDCVEGWSAIGKWTGVPLGDLMHEVHPMPTAKFAVFYCADVDDEGVFYYESIVLADCYHPQTILAYELNGAPLDVPHGAPLRLRFERQLGYKQAKYVMRIELVESLFGIGGGKGGYWEDQGYEWYAGI